jgi:hypothetical protein
VELFDEVTNYYCRKDQLIDRSIFKQACEEAEASQHLFLACECFVVLFAVEGD